MIFSAKLTSTKKNDSQDSKSFLKLIGSAIGALGGFAALFVAFGYITLQSFLSNMKLYGLAYFPLQFYKEASVTFLRDIARFYSDYYLLILSSIFIIILPLLFRRYKEKIAGGLKKLILGLSILISLFAVFCTLSLGIFNNDCKDIIFNALSLPVLLAIFLYLVVYFQDFNFKIPLKNFYSLFIIIFIVFFLSIPIGYGSFLYDIAVFTASVPDCSSEHTAFGVASMNNFKLLYLMGHTSDREVFFDVTSPPITIILVDKKLINSIRVSYNKDQTKSLRRLHDEIEQKDFFGEDFEWKKIIPGELEMLNKEDIDKWMLDIEDPDKKGDKK